MNGLEHYGSCCEHILFYHCWRVVAVLFHYESKPVSNTWCSMALIPTLRQQTVYIYIVSRPQFCGSRCLTVSRLPHREDPALLVSPYGGVHWYLFKDLHCWQVLTVVFTGIFLRCHGLSQLCMTLASIPLGTESTACSPTCWKPTVPTDLQTYI